MSQRQPPADVYAAHFRGLNDLQEEVLAARGVQVLLESFLYRLAAEDGAANFDKHHADGVSFLLHAQQQRIEERQEELLASWRNVPRR